MEKDKKEEEKEVKVTDKRRFIIDEKGRVDVRGVECEEDSSGGKNGDRPGEASRGPEGRARGEAPGECTPVPIDFSGLVLSLSTSVMIHLGEVPDPITREKQVELPQAKQTIDILAILEEKTRGNLTKEEEMLLRDILTDLRFRYVEKSKTATAN